MAERLLVSYCSWLMSVNTTNWVFCSILGKPWLPGVLIGNIGHNSVFDPPTCRGFCRSCIWHQGVGKGSREGSKSCYIKTWALSRFERTDHQHAFKTIKHHINDSNITYDIIIYIKIFLKHPNIFSLKKTGQTFLQYSSCPHYVKWGQFACQQHQNKAWLKPKTLQM